jgi:hypothetical protein
MSAETRESARIIDRIGSLRQQQLIKVAQLSFLNSPLFGARTNAAFRASGGDDQWGCSLISFRTS